MDILIAEDDTASRKILEAKLKKWGFSVLAVTNGAEALEALQEEDHPHMALLDWEMPELDGVEVCRQVRELPEREDLYLILLTGRTHNDDIVHGLSAGADDYLTKPFEKSELEARLNVGRRTIELRNRLREEIAKVSEANARLNSSLEAAAAVQKSLLPASLPDVDGFEFEFKYMPSEHLGGDILDIFSYEDSIICYAVDVSGHGVPSALVSVTVHNAIGRGQTTVEQKHAMDDPVAMVNHLSKHFAGLLQRTNLYFTMLYGVLNPSSGEFRFVQAGHPFPMVRQGDKCFEVDGTPNLPVGIMATEYKEHVVQVDEGGEIYIYTDGITESQRGPDLFGAEGFAKSIVAGSPGAGSLDRLIEHSLQWSGESVFDDDATAIRMSRLSK